MNRRSFLRGLMASAAVAVVPTVPASASFVRMSKTVAFELGLPALYGDLNTDMVDVLTADLRAWVIDRLADGSWITPPLLDRVYGPTEGGGGLAELLK